MSELAQHVTEAGKTVAGGVACAVGSFGCSNGIAQYFNIEHATEYATLAASIATALYFSVTTYIALAKWKIEKNAKSSKA